MRPRLTAVLAAPVLAAVVWSAGGGGFPVLAPTAQAAAAVTPSAVVVTDGPGPAKAYDCAFNLNTDAFTGAYGTASAIGWEGNQQGVVTCLGGTFLVQDGIFHDFGFGIYHGARTTWTDADGYLPAQITTFPDSGAKVSITEFADRVVLGGHAYVAVYSRVAVANPTDRTVMADPEAAPGMVQLDSAPDAVGPHTSVAHDYVVAADRFGHTYPWPSARALFDAGGFDRHFAHMSTFWNRQLAGIAQIRVPDAALEDAYRSGFISTQIARSGDDLDTGVNGYESEFSHDVVGILTNLFTQGDFTDAHALLLEARHVVGSQGQYQDGVWTYSVPWAVYLMKTGDIGFVKANFDSNGPAGAAEPSIEATAHEIAADRTGPSQIMMATDDIDTEGYWTTDDFEALLGLAAYRYLAQRVGDTAEATWASEQYDGLLASTNATLEATIHRDGLDYLPCSILQPDTANRCVDPEDANWTSPLGNWAWEGYLLGAPQDGPGLSLIDATYRYGFDRLQGKLPPDTFGGFPDDYYSSAYNAADGTAGLAGVDYRDQGILSYQFMIEHSQSGPNSWWESSTAPDPATPWVGSHPGSGQGSSPHAWGMAGANRVLLDSLVAQRWDGTLVVGRGIPALWLREGRPIAVSNFPIAGDRRLSLRITTTGRTVSLTLAGAEPTGRILFELPSFVANIASSSAGSIDEGTGTVALRPGTDRVVIDLRRAP
jgi:hypothetical protein